MNQLDHISTAQKLELLSGFSQNKREYLALEYSNFIARFYDLRSEAETSIVCYE